MYLPPTLQYSQPLTFIRTIMYFPIGVVSYGYTPRSLDPWLLCGPKRVTKMWCRRARSCGRCHLRGFPLQSPLSQQNTGWSSPTRTTQTSQKLRHISFAGRITYSMTGWIAANLLIKEDVGVPPSSVSSHNKDGRLLRSRMTLVDNDRKSMIIISKIFIMKKKNPYHYFLSL